MPVSDTLIDTLFDGRYRVISRLGSGGMADVYLAEDQELGRRVALKILNDRHANDDQFVERFRREAKNAAGLSHPNIVSIYDRGEAEGTYYIAMEHLDGRTLKELIRTRGPAPVGVAIEYARQILAALRFAHRNGIVHRDIKPHNVLVDGDGRLKVTDFGIARAGASQMTEVGSIVGTAQYLSPEQARGTSVDQRSDLYSLGVVLYELLTGKLPFSGDTPVEVAMKHLSDTPTPPSQIRPDVPHDLDLIVMRALAKDPDARYADADEMDRDLERVAGGGAVSRDTLDAATAVIARPSTAATMISRAPTRVREPTPAAVYEPAPYFPYEEERPRRRPLWPWLLTVLLIAGAIVAGWYVYDQIQEQLAETKPVSVPYLEERRESLAVATLVDADIRYRVVRRPSAEQPQGFVYDQEPDGGEKIDRATDRITIFVSTGIPTALVPDVRGEPRDDAVAMLTARKLRYRVFEVPSKREVGIVTGQAPPPGERVKQGTVVRINVSRGPQLVAVPSVEGLPFESANGTLQGAGFSVARARDQDSNQPAGIVIDQEPAGGASAARGSTVTLIVSKGPQTTVVPEVTSQDRATAEQTLRNSGFRISVTEQPTDDPTLDNVVLEQDPSGSTQAKPGSTVRIVVGRYEPPSDEIPIP